MSNKLNDVMTASEATQQFNLSNAAIRKYIVENRLEQRGVARKSGNTWLILTDYATEKWGQKYDIIETGERVPECDVMKLARARALELCEYEGQYQAHKRDGDYYINNTLFAVRYPPLPEWSIKS